MRLIRIISGLFLCLTLFGSVSAWANHPAGHNWQLLIDPSARLNLADVSSALYRSQFRPVDSRSLTFPASPAAYWLSVELDPHEQERTLHLFAPDLDYLDIYLQENNELLRHTSTGTQLPFSSRPAADKDFLFSIEPTAQPRQLILRLQSDRPVRPQIQLGTSAEIASTLRSEDLVFGLLLGTLLMLTLYNGVRYFYNRAKPGLWLAAMHGALILAALSITGH